MKKLKSSKKEGMIVTAKLWKRLAALVIDFVLINLILFSPFRGVMEDIMPETTDFQEMLNYIQNNPEVANNINFIAMIMASLAILYFAIMERIFAQTIGKMLMHIKVKSLNEKLKLWQCFVRSLYLIPYFSLFIIIEPISLLFIKDNRRVLELLSKTRTVEDNLKG
tara:strand:- start:764 stop:1261 length:498 start_codon:yes stop_codon:yes gene_type:complete